mmetsp:Transcript_53909/g.114530  ORF Transcript_53909/g.114530 Transcript_53909/m.114530 type:complete len:92 (-) Transcript_53909:111-386(-)
MLYTKQVRIHPAHSNSMNEMSIFQSKCITGRSPNTSSHAARYLVPSLAEKISAAICGIPSQEATSPIQSVAYPHLSKPFIYQNVQVSKHAY